MMWVCWAGRPRVMPTWSSFLAQVLAHPLYRLFNPLVRGGQRDAEEALAAGPVHRAGRDDDGGLLEHQLAEGGRGVALGDRRPDVDRALRRGHLDADLAEGGD